MRDNLLTVEFMRAPNLPKLFRAGTQVLQRVASGDRFIASGWFVTARGQIDKMDTAKLLQLPDHMPDGSRQFPGARWGGAEPGWKGRQPDKLPDYAIPRFDGIGANEYGRTRQ